MSGVALAPSELGGDAESNPCKEGGSQRQIGRYSQMVDQEELARASLEPKEIEFDIPEDAYGAATLAIVRDFQEAFNGNAVTLNLVTGIFALTLNMLNLTLQFMIVGYIQLYVVEPKVHKVQILYKDFHASAFDASGKFIPSEWEEFDRQQEICQVAMTNSGFYATALFLWWASMMKELRTTWRLFLNITQMPCCSRGADMLRLGQEHASHECSDHEAEAQTVHIVALTMTTRLALYLLVCFPKLIICMALLWSGSEWLSATSKFEDLIMNAVAMTFVTHIDELLYDVLLPAKYRDEVSAINFVLPYPEKLHPREIRDREMWSGFRRSALYVAIILAGIFTYAYYVQDVLPHDLSDLRMHCRHYMTSVKPVCKVDFLDRVWAIVSNSPVSRECYPYG